MKQNNVIVSKDGLNTIGYAQDIQKYFVDLACELLAEGEKSDETRSSSFEEAERIIYFLRTTFSDSELLENGSLMKVREDSNGWYDWNYIF